MLEQYIIPQINPWVIVQRASYSQIEIFNFFVKGPTLVSIEMASSLQIMVCRKGYCCTKIVVEGVYALYSGVEKVHYCDIIFRNIISIHEILAYHFEDGCSYQSGRQYQIKNLKSEAYSISI